MAATVATAPSAPFSYQEFVRVTHDLLFSRRQPHKLEYFDYANVRQLAQRLAEYRRAARSVVTVLIVGASGAGKSALVNALLHRPVTAEGNSAASQTDSLVVVRLHFGADRVLELIDTPGLGDTSAPDKDELTMNVLREFGENYPPDYTLFVSGTQRLDLGVCAAYHNALTFKNRKFFDGSVAIVFTRIQQYIHSRDIPNEHELFRDLRVFEFWSSPGRKAAGFPDAPPAFCAAESKELLLHEGGWWATNPNEQPMLDWRSRLVLQMVSQIPNAEQQSILLDYLRWTDDLTEHVTCSGISTAAATAAPPSSAGVVGGSFPRELMSASTDAASLSKHCVVHLYDSGIIVQQAEVSLGRALRSAQEWCDVQHLILVIDEGILRTADDVGIVQQYCSNLCSGAQRFTLIRASSEARVACHESSDFSKVSETLQALPVKPGSSSRNIAAGLKSAVTLIPVIVHNSTRVVLLTDSAADTAATLAARQLRATGVSLLVVGIGTECAHLRRIAAPSMALHVDRLQALTEIAAPAGGFSPPSSEMFVHVRHIAPAQLPWSFDKDAVHTIRVSLCNTGTADVPAGAQIRCREWYTARQRAEHTVFGPPKPFWCPAVTTVPALPSKRLVSLTICLTAAPDANPAALPAGVEFEFVSADGHTPLPSGGAVFRLRTDFFSIGGYVQIVVASLQSADQASAIGALVSCLSPTRQLARRPPVRFLERLDLAEFPHFGDNRMPTLLNMWPLDLVPVPEAALFEIAHGKIRIGRSPQQYLTERSGTFGVANHGVLFLVSPSDLASNARLDVLRQCFRTTHLPLIVAVTLPSDTPLTEEVKLAATASRALSGDVSGAVFVLRTYRTDATEKEFDVDRTAFCVLSEIVRESLPRVSKHVSSPSRGSLPTSSPFSGSLRVQDLREESDAKAQISALLRARTAQYKSYTVLIVGEGQSGKTSFANCLGYRLLPPHERAWLAPTADIRVSRFPIGSDCVMQVIDTPDISVSNNRSAIRQLLRHFSPDVKIFVLGNETRLNIRSLFEYQQSLSIDSQEPFFDENTVFLRTHAQWLMDNVVNIGGDESVKRPDALRDVLAYENQWNSHVPSWNHNNNDRTIPLPSAFPPLFWAESRDALLHNGSWWMTDRMRRPVLDFRLALFQYLERRSLTADKRTVLLSYVQSATFHQSLPAVAAWQFTSSPTQAPPVPVSLRAPAGSGTTPPSAVAAAAHQHSLGGPAPAIASATAAATESNSSVSCAPPPTGPLSSRESTGRHPAHPHVLTLVPSPSDAACSQCCSKFARGARLWRCDQCAFGVCDNCMCNPASHCAHCTGMPAQCACLSKCGRKLQSLCRPMG